MEWFLITCLITFVMMIIAGAISEGLVPLVFWGVILISLGLAFPLFGFCLLGLFALILLIATFALIGYIIKNIGGFLSKISSWIIQFFHWNRHKNDDDEFI